MDKDKTVDEILYTLITKSKNNLIVIDGVVNDISFQSILEAKQQLYTHYRKKFAGELFKKLENSSKYLEYGNTSLGEMYIRVDDIKKVLEVDNG